MNGKCCNMMEGFLCALCQDVLLKPVAVNCKKKHKFCEDCIDEWTHEKGKNTCPTCHSKISRIEDPDVHFMHHYLNLEMKCTYYVDGCKKILTVATHEAHEKLCEYGPNALVDCGKGCEIARKDLPNHECRRYLRAKAKELEEALALREKEVKEMKLHFSRMARKENPRVFLCFTADDVPIGRIVFELRSDVVPKASTNFLALCTGAYGRGYKESVVERISTEEGAIYGGLGALGGVGWKPENFQLKHDGPGTLSRIPVGNSRRQSKSRFLITLKKRPDLDDKLVVIGKVIDGLEVLEEFLKFGSPIGQVSKTVIVTNCGQLS